MRLNTSSLGTLLKASLNLVASAMGLVTLLRGWVVVWGKNLQADQLQAVKWLTYLSFVTLGLFLVASFSLFVDVLDGYRVTIRQALTTGPYCQMFWGLVALLLSVFCVLSLVLS